MEKMLAEGTLSLKNLNTNPGVTYSSSGLAATENLTKPFSAPLKIPV